MGNTATLLTTPESDASPGSSLLMKNTGTVPIYVGGYNVTVADGYPVAAGEYLAIDLGGKRDLLYGIVSTGSGEVRNLRVGV